jgi:integrase/recombinase XerD
MTGKAVVALTQDELRALLLKTREHDHRAYLLFLITVLHGCRVSEVINLKVKDLSFDGTDWYLSVQRLKGSNQTTQKLISSSDPLFDEARLISEWLQGMKPKEFIFLNTHNEPLTRWGVNYLVSQYGRWSEIPEHKRFPHALKHTCGIQMRKSGAKLEEIQNALGHKRLDSTAMYLRVTQDEVDDARAKAFGAGLGA